MNLRLIGATKRFLVPLLLTALLPAATWADGPGYTYAGISYEWTDVKFGIDPSSSTAYNNGDIEGVNLDASLGLLGWFHIAGEYFDGDCNNCGGNPSNLSDLDFKGFQAGIGFNPSLGFIGDAWADTDIVLRGNYVDVELGDVCDNSGTSCDGFSIQGQIRSQISERAEFQIGYQYQDVGDATNRDMTIGLMYRVWDGIALTARGIIFDDDTGFDLGVRWYFGELIFGDRDSVVR